MPAARCSTCGISYPDDHATCLVCGENTAYFTNVKPDDDWRETVRQANSTSFFAGMEGEQVLDWRFKRFVALGCNREQALSLAADRWLDLHYFEYRLLRRGCSVELACRIMAPLP